MLSKLCSIFCPADTKPAEPHEADRSKQLPGATTRSTEMFRSDTHSSTDSDNPFTELVQLLTHKTDAEFFLSFAQFDSAHETEEALNDAVLENLFFLEKMISRRILVERICEISNRDITGWIRSESRLRHM